MNIDQIQEFLKAGKPTFTVVSNKTGEHRTFKGQMSDNGKMLWVSLLVAPDTYQYAGTLFPATWDYRTTAKSPANHPIHKVLGYFAAGLRMKDLRQMEFKHAGRCGRCGRELTTPESIDAGLGPVCRGLM